MTGHDAVEVGKEGAEGSELLGLHFREGLLDDGQLVVRIDRG